MGIIMEEKKTFQDDKSKRLIKIIIIMLIILFIISVATFGAIYYLQLKQFKVIVNGTQNTNIEKAFITENGKVYVSIKEIAPFLGYTAYNGEYGKKYSEDKTKCYLQNNNESVTYSLDSNSIYKSIITEKLSDGNLGTTNKLLSTDTSYEYFTLEEPVKSINDKLYCALNDIQVGTNTVISYNEKDNTVNIYTLDYIIKRYANSVSDIAVADTSAIFSNKKAILYNFIIVKSNDNKYGVSKIENGQIEELIGKKYEYIKFVESTQEFIVLTEEGKMGTIRSDGTTRINPVYDEIKQIDKEEGLYLVSQNQKYGVITKDGEKVIFIEYDSIGIDTSKFPQDNIENQYILYNNYIPVEKAGKWGILDKKGNTVVNLKYDGLGSVVSNSSTNAASVILIPEYEAIVARQGEYFVLINMADEKLLDYTLATQSSGTLFVTGMYSETTEEKKDYYFICKTADNKGETYTYNLIETLKVLLKEENN